MAINIPPGAFKGVRSFGAGAPNAGVYAVSVSKATLSTQVASLMNGFSTRVTMVDKVTLTLFLARRVSQDLTTRLRVG